MKDFISDKINHNAFKILKKDNMAILNIVNYMESIVIIVQFVLNANNKIILLQMMENTVIYSKVKALLKIVNFIKIWMEFKDAYNVKMDFNTLILTGPIIPAESVLIINKNLRKY